MRKTYTTLVKAFALLSPIGCDVLRHNVDCLRRQPRYARLPHGRRWRCPSMRFVPHRKTYMQRNYKTVHCLFNVAI